MVDDELMSETVPGSQNEVIRRQFVHLPPEDSHSGTSGSSLWWPSDSDQGPQDRIQMQMRHVPRNYQRDRQTIKTIYLPGGCISSIVTIL